MVASTPNGLAPILKVYINRQHGKDVHFHSGLGSGHSNCAAMGEVTLVSVVAQSDERQREPETCRLVIKTDFLTEVPADNERFSQWAAMDETLNCPGGDSRSLNRCAHGHLACKFPINVTVPGRSAGHFDCNDQRK
jgi:hypothetical protein